MMNELTVFGMGRVSATPNLAKIILGVQNVGDSVEAIQAENANLLLNVMNALKSFQIKDEDIRTSEYQIIPVYDFIDGNQQFKHYQITHLLDVNIRDLDETGEIIDAAVRSGANQVLSIEFTLEDVSEIEEQALVKALNDAKRKAQVIVNTLDVELDVPPIYVKEIKEGSQPFFQRTMLFENSSATSIQPGKLIITSQVEVMYHYL
ncbi:SIMPL domain-containing protein [Alkalihalobacillus trypoxylicola]|nr:SIMPL domain-containing protein [Alkalihalobacillus trypoxylicola]